MSIYKRGKFYWHKFMWSGEQVRESHQTEQRQVARQITPADKVRRAHILRRISS
jgi:hypothetical protein